MFMSKFNFIATEIPGVIIIEPTVFGDSRGYFMETYQAEEFAAAGIPGPFVQDNQSKSTRGVLRGLHFQKEHTPGQAGARGVSGEVLRRCAWICRRRQRDLSAKWVRRDCSLRKIRSSFMSRRALPTAFWCCPKTAEFTYKCTDYYDPAAEGGVKWDDPDVGIVWPAVDGEIRLSAKDGEHRGFKEQTYEFFERW